MNLLPFRLHIDGFRFPRGLAQNHVVIHIQLRDVAVGGRRAGPVVPVDGCTDLFPEKGIPTAVRSLHPITLSSHRMSVENQVGEERTERPVMEGGARCGPLDVILWSTAEQNCQPSMCAWCNQRSTQSRRTIVSLSGCMDVFLFRAERGPPERP